MRSIRTVDAVLVVGVMLLVAVTLLPAVARMHRTAAESQCQSNLQRWAEALALYVSDNEGTYPTNRTKTGSTNYYMALSPQADDPATGKPYRFYYSINWVEALYPYLWGRAHRTGQDWRTFRRCPNARAKTWPYTVSPNGYPFPVMDYVLNRNFLECPEAALRRSHKVMTIREFYVTTIALCRPMNVSAGQSGVRPQYAFNNGDTTATSTENSDPSVWRTHGEGSYIAFADGHVGYFTLDYFPTYAAMTATKCWDAETQQWWNYAPGSGKTAPYLMSIAVTP
jgi:prepilin-type processing-associated H-X9-DG protein